MRRRVRPFLILLLTLGLLAFTLRNANLQGVWAETRRADAVPLVLALLATLATYALRALRWQYLLAPLGKTRFSTAFRATVIGFAASFLLPARAGEIIRPYILARRENLSAPAAFATIILERLLDLLIVLLLFALFVLTVGPGVVAGDPSELARVKLGGVTAVVAALAGVAFFFVMAGHPERLGRLARRLEAILPARLSHALAGFVETFTQGLAVMRQPRRLMISLALSFPLWLSIAAGIWLTSQAFHITFPFQASFLVMAVLVVGVAVPTPGAIGGFHAAYEFAVATFFAAPPDRAVGAAFVLHAISFVPVTILGVLFMVGEGLTLAGAREMAASGAADNDPKGPPRQAATAADPGDSPAVRTVLGAPVKRGAR
jgi:glycosyltransferase 2 family protein